MNPTTDNLEIQLAKLTTLVTLKFEQVFGEIKDLKQGIAERVSGLERTKADNEKVANLQDGLSGLQKKVNDDIEGRVEKLELGRAANQQAITEANRYTLLLIGLGIIMLGVIIYHLSGYHI